MQASAAIGYKYDNRKKCGERLLRLVGELEHSNKYHASS